MSENNNTTDFQDKLKGCVIAGGFGDACGLRYENSNTHIKELIPSGFSDDTQLTVATLESILRHKKIIPEKIAENFLAWYKAKKLSGLGSATLQALQGLSVGGHWLLVGKQGEYAAGNGAAMRIAPLAFYCNPDEERELIRDVVSITHKNEEAYCGALAIVYSVYYFLRVSNESQNLIPYVCEKIPDSNTRDKLILLQNKSISISECAVLSGCGGLTSESVPFAIYTSTLIESDNYPQLLKEIISCGGDCDTNASLFSQIAGSLSGFKKIKRFFPERFEENEIFSCFK